MSTFTVRSEEFPPSLEIRTLHLHKGIEIKVPPRAKLANFGLSDDRVVSITFFNGSLAYHLVAYDNLNLKPLCVECITAFLGAQEQKPYIPEVLQPGYGIAPGQRII